MAEDAIFVLKRLWFKWGEVKAGFALMEKLKEVKKDYQIIHMTKEEYELFIFTTAKRRNDDRKAEKTKL